MQEAVISENRRSELAEMKEKVKCSLYFFLNWILEYKTDKIYLLTNYKCCQVKLLP